MLVDFFCEKEFGFVEQTGYGAAFVQEFEDLFSDCGIVAAENGGTARLQEVDVLVAVDVIKVSTIRLCHANGERIVERKVVLDAAGDKLFGFRDNLFGFGALGIEVFQNFLSSSSEMQ